MFGSYSIIPQLFPDIHLLPTKLYVLLFLNPTRPIYAAQIFLAGYSSTGEWLAYQKLYSQND